MRSAKQGNYLGESQAGGQSEGGRGGRWLALDLQKLKSSFQDGVGKLKPFLIVDSYSRTRRYSGKPMTWTK